MLAPVAALLLMAALLGFCWYALVASRCHDDSDAQLNELLVEDVLLNEQPFLSGNRHPPALPAEPGNAG